MANLEYWAHWLRSTGITDEVKIANYSRQFVVQQYNDPNEVELHMLESLGFANVDAAVISRHVQEYKAMDEDFSDVLGPSLSNSSLPPIARVTSSDSNLLAPVKLDDDDDDDDADDDGGGARHKRKRGGAAPFVGGGPHTAVPVSSGSSLAPAGHFASTASSATASTANGYVPHRQQLAVSLATEPTDAVFSGRSTQLYTLQVSAASVTRVALCLENDSGDRVGDGAHVEHCTVSAPDARGFIGVALRVRFKSQRLQVRRAVFEVDAADGAGGTGLVTCRSSRFIVCSHITSQREIAEQRLRQVATRASFGTLGQQLGEHYGQLDFARALQPDDVAFLRGVACRCLGLTPPVANAALVDTTPFFAWFDKALKQCKRVQTYWDSGAIVGFVHRNRAEELLRAQPPGTALVRLSESVPKAFAVTVMESSGTVSNKMIDKSASGDWQLFKASLRSFSGNITSVLTTGGARVALDDAFPDQSTADNTAAVAEEAGYDETATVREMVSALRLDDSSSTTPSPARMDE